MDNHAGGKWFIHGPKLRMDNQLLSLKHLIVLLRFFIITFCTWWVRNLAINIISLALSLSSLRIIIMSSLTKLWAQFDKFGVCICVESFRPNEGQQTAWIQQTMNEVYSNRSEVPYKYTETLPVWRMYNGGPYGRTDQAWTHHSTVLIHTISTTQFLLGMTNLRIWI